MSETVFKRKGLLPGQYQLRESHCDSWFLKEVTMLRVPHW